MYRPEPDPYCYPGTTVLINRASLRDPAELEEFEAEMTSLRFREPFPGGRLSYRHYLAVHRHLFQDVYSWAGKIRTVRIFKQDSAFCYPEHIDREMRRLFAGLAKQSNLRRLEARPFAGKAAHLLAELNAVHPFREGNGRTQLSFLVLLAANAGHRINREGLKPRPTLKAMIASFNGNEKPLAELIERSIQAD
jgi:cell filamentation protein